MATDNLREFFVQISENIELGEDFDINDIPEVALPEAYNDNFHSNFLTLTSAKNNQDVMKHFRGKYLSNADNRLKAAYLAKGGKEEDFNEFNGKEPDSMKLIDLIVGDLAKLKSSSNAPSNNKEHEAYKIQTAKQIEDFIAKEALFEEKLSDSLSDNNSVWSNRVKSEMINAKLSSKSFNDSMSREDSVFLINRKVENSDFELRLDDDLKQSVYSKKTGMEAVIDGKNVDWDYVLDNLSYDYTKKNDQATTPPPARQVTVPTVNATNEDGRYIVGHPDYNKF